MIACIYAPIDGLVPDMWRFINFSNSNNNALCTMRYELYTMHYVVQPPSVITLIIALTMHCAKHKGEETNEDQLHGVETRLKTQRSTYWTRAYM